MDLVVQGLGIYSWSEKNSTLCGLSRNYDRRPQPLKPQTPSTLKALGTLMTLKTLEHQNS